MALGMGFVTPNIYDEWWHRDRTYMRHDFDAPYRSAETWLAANTDPRDVIVTDNVVWTDLVHSLGRPQETTVWFTKVGVDPGVDATITSWRDIDYFVVSDIIAIGDMPAILHEAIDNSTPVQSWGSGWQRIEIR
ncbi:MAG: glycosyltransferase, partial [Micrococcales bacterium]